MKYIACIHSISNSFIQLLWIWILVDEKYQWLQYQHSVLLWGQKVDSIGTETSINADHFHCFHPCFIKQCKKPVPCHYYIIMGFLLCPVPFKGPNVTEQNQHGLHASPILVI